jgi:hypothetical protein
LALTCLLFHPLFAAASISSPATAAPQPLSTPAVAESVRWLTTPEIARPPRKWARLSPEVHESVLERAALLSWTWLSLASFTPTQAPTTPPAHSGGEVLGADARREAAVDRRLDQLAEHADAAAISTPGWCDPVAAEKALADDEAAEKWARLSPPNHSSRPGMASGREEEQRGAEGSGHAGSGPFGVLAAAWDLD